ncbi:hypothetical protein [Rossellomorea marisflavi]|uniref:hypothetical protein n=1 Tax=Rossellomorea marisflavi TaxID=189381 RepID=UPI00207A92C5|nr:hypothetical protein [Rossellomorea marisflavi]USK90489.1 hypothetical protein LIT29_12980 [Rossellomorea marisflavi]
MMTSEELLEAYRNMYKGRRLEHGDREPLEVLREAIKRELQDEFSHPRIRKGPLDKFYLATKRISDSPFPAEVKEKLIQCHILVMSELI